MRIFPVLFALILLSRHVFGQITILNGGGASFALPVFERWWMLYATLEPVTVMYKGIGSYFGKRWIRGRIPNKGTGANILSRSDQEMNRNAWIDSAGDLVCKAAGKHNSKKA